MLSEPAVYNIKDHKTYFKQLTGLTPTPDQVRLMKSIIKHNRVLVSSGRQCGKTLSAAVVTIWLAFEYPEPLRILLISAQSNEIYYHIRNIFQHYREYEDEIVSRGSRHLIPASGFETLRGTIVRVRGATERAIRGFPADIVVIDEAALVYDDIILTALGNLSGPVSKFILLSTPRNEEGLFSRWLTDPEFHIHHWSGEHLSWHSQDLLKTKKSVYSPAQYATEVLGRLPNPEELEQSGTFIGRVVIGDWLRGGKLVKI